MWLEGLPAHKQEDTEGTLWGSGEAAWAPWAASGRGPEREGEEPAGAGGAGLLAPADAGAALQALHYGRSSSQVSSWGQKSTISPWATAPPRLTQKQGPRHAWHPTPICDADSGGTQGQASTCTPCQPMGPLFTIHALLCPSLLANESYSLTEAVTLPLTHF